MQCPGCEGDVDVTLFNTETSADERGVEISFTFPWCRREYYEVLYPVDFCPVT